MRFRSRQFARLMSFSLLILIAALSTFSAAQAQEANANHLPKRIVGDYSYSSKNQTPPYSAAQIPFHQLTHINHAGVSFAADGSLSVPDGFIEPELTNLAHAAGVKVLLLLGGDFVGLETSGAVQTLVDNIAAFNHQHHYDGVDIDWEYPATSTDRAFFVKLMDLLRQSNSHYALSIDVAPWGGYGYNLTKLPLAVDFFNIMMYDCAGSWTAYGQLNSPIFWDYHDPAPYECQPGGSAEEAANIFLRACASCSTQYGYSLLRLPLHQHQSIVRVVSKRSHNSRRGM